MPFSEFNGFPKETFRFLNDLHANNAKDWFDANRECYDACWKSPALALTQALVQPMAALSPPLKAEARINGTLRRINRDVRFSRDKSPYNARIHMIFWAGSHPNRSPAFHLVIKPEGIGYGAGVFGLDAVALAAIRSRIVNANDRTGLLEAIESAASVGCDFDEPDLKRLPRGFEASGEWEHLLRRKALVVRTMQDIETPGWIFTPEAPAQIMMLAQALMPLIRWLVRV